jgi:ABC-type nickel/cobalt efflux system permease component RcnA
MEMGGRQHAPAALPLEKRRNLCNNSKSSTKIIAHVKSRKRKTDIRKSINGEHEELLSPLNAETGLWDPILRAGRRRIHPHTHAHTHTRTHTHAHTHTHTHTHTHGRERPFTINIDQIHILNNWSVNKLLDLIYKICCPLIYENTKRELAIPIKL